MPTLTDLERAIAIVEDSRQTHVNWAKWRRRGGKGDDGAGDLEHHETAIRDYDHVLAVLAVNRLPLYEEALDSLAAAVPLLEDEWVGTSEDSVGNEWLRAARSILSKLGRGIELVGGTDG